MRLDIHRISADILADARARERIARDLASGAAPETEEELVRLLTTHAAPRPLGPVVPSDITNEEVFREAVRTLAGSGRVWSAVARNMPAVGSLLRDYDPVAAHRAVLDRTLTAEMLQPLLPGQSGPGDARGMLRWARLLCEMPDYAGYLQSLSEALQSLSGELRGTGLSQTELHLCVVGYLGNPPGRWAGTSHLRRRVDPRYLKAPGMGYMLTVEFLRRLGWDGIRVDSHVQRLLDRWAPRLAEDQLSRAEGLMALVGRSDRLLRLHLTYSLAAHALLPEGVSPVQADTLLSVLGAYVERRGCESEEARYLRRPAA